jgi:hypothetical protein
MYMKVRLIFMGQTKTRFHKELASLDRLTFRVSAGFELALGARKRTCGAISGGIARYARETPG